jgi:predicted Zn finger-like uncharacterized protein
MLVRCPKCLTTYKVSDDLLKGNAPAFRCSRCKHTFELDPHSTPQSASETFPPAALAVAPGQDQELSLPFEAKQDAELNGVTKSEPDQPDLTGPEAVEPRADAGDGWSIHAPAVRSESEQRFVMAENDRPIESAKVLDDRSNFSVDDRFFSKTEAHDESEDADNILAIASYRDQRASILPFVSLFCLLVISFGLFSVISYANPQTTERIIGAVPVVGRSVLRNNHLKEGILVQSLRSSYQTIQGNREVFLISGVALNQNTEVVREIQLSGITYNEGGKELERQTIWVGNTISPKIIRGMTTEDIPHLQDLKPLKTFEIPPGDSMPFTIVFLKSAKSAKTFSYEVLAAEGAV